MCRVVSLVAMQTKTRLDYGWGVWEDLEMLGLDKTRQAAALWKNTKSDCNLITRLNNECRSL